MGHQQGYTMSIVGPVCHSSAWACCDWPAFQTFQSPKMRQCFGQKAISIFTIVLMTVYNYCLDNMLQLSNGKKLKVVSPELLMSWPPLYFAVEHICCVLPIGLQNLNRLNKVWPIWIGNNNELFLLEFRIEFHEHNVPVEHITFASVWDNKVPLYSTTGSPDLIRLVAC